MNSIILELQREALNDNITVVSLLRKSSVVASKLGLEEFGNWIKQELGGYSNGDVPAYRQVHGEPKYFNPYNGWQPVIIQDERIRRIFSNSLAANPVSELEDIYNNQSLTREPAFINYSVEKEKYLLSFMEFEVQVGLIVHAPAIKRILDAVRQHVLDWCLRLEKDGILGSGLSFSNEEKKAATKYSFHIQNMHGSQIQIESQDSKQIITDTGVGTSIATFIKLVDEHKSQIGLNAQQISEISQSLRDLKEELESENPTTKRMHSALSLLKGVLENSAGNVIASGLLYKLGEIGKLVGLS